MLEEVVRLFRASKRPLIHVGQGARHAQKEFFDLVEGLQIPFVTARNANDLCDWNHPLLVGRPGTFAQRGANFAVQQADFYLAIGTRLSLTQTGYASKDYARNAQIIQVDIDQPELDKGTLRDPISICMDAKDFLIEITKELERDVPSTWEQTKQSVDWLNRRDSWEAWLKRCQSWKARYPVCLPEYWEQKDFVNLYVFVDALAELALPTDVIVTDMGQAFQGTHQGWKTKKGQRLMTNCGLAPMGWGLPAAVGAAFAIGSRILLITGDGGLMMNVQELATVMHHNLNIKIFVLNNGGYLTIKQTQELGFEGRLMGVNEETGLSFPWFPAIADAHDLDVTRIHNHSELDKLEYVLREDKPRFCEIMMSPDQPQAPRSLNRRNPDGTMNPTRLEDAFPFLDPKIIEEEMKL